MLTVLGYEGPQLRSYLLFLKAHTIPVRHLVLLAPLVDVATKKPVARFLPKPLRAAMGLKLLGMRMQHWPQMIALRHAELYRTITNAMATRYTLPDGLYDKLLKPFVWQDYATQVDKVAFSGSLKDAALHDWLAGHVSGAVLYTGGGIVRPALLAIEGLRVLHVHPGYLPHVRGADGLLWSALLRKKIGVSGFYMEAGIDTGDLLFAEEQDMPAFDPIPEDTDDDMLYRALFAFIDPVIRAEALCRYLQGKPDLMALPATAQNRSAGETFHFMHPDLRNKVLRQLFK